ncbi:MAG: alpha/beta fold hydrolase [Stappiaceae bacterium]
MSDQPVKETLVLLPGMMCTWQLFEPQIKAFENEYNVVVPELSAPSIVEMAQAVLQTVETPQFNLAGLSMGGIVAMQVCDLAPERVSRLALLDTNHHADLRERFAVRNRQIADVKSGQLRAVIVEEMKPIYLAAENQRNQLLLDLLIQMAVDVGPATFINQSIALRDRLDQTSSIKSWKRPTLVLCGTEDRLCPPERHQEMAELIHGSILEILPGAGHITTLEQPQLTTDALRNWLRSAGEQRKRA